jgi:hypothetical protein
MGLWKEGCAWPGGLFHTHPEENPFASTSRSYGAAEFSKILKA